MTFLIDEDVAVEIDRSLRQTGPGTVRVAEVLGFRTDDVDVWEHACRHDLIVITCNRQDFLELAGEAPSAGLIILNRRRSRPAECAATSTLRDSDGQGLAPASTAVRIDVVGDPVPLLAIERSEPGQVRLKVVGQPGAAYVLERSAEPSGVGSLRWTTISNFVFALPDRQITEPVRAGNTPTFYRVRRQ